MTTHPPGKNGTPRPSGPAVREPAAGRRYVIITPCRNEARFIRATLETVAAQTVPPALWVVVDDGSTDETPDILDAYARKLDFLRVVRIEDRGFRSVGPGVVHAFYRGLAEVDLDDFDYLCKLDADLELPPAYFESIIKHMEREPLLGNMSGKTYIRLPDGRLVSERLGDENAIGAAKFYRTSCFRDIGGFVREVSWDGIDGHMCRMKGWIAMSSDDPDLRIVHLRQMGSSQVGLWQGRKRWGRGKWFMGSAWYYVLAVAAFRSFERPFVLGGLGILAGYFGAMLTRRPRFDAPGFRRHLRRYELASLLYGKRGAMRRFHERLRRHGPRPDLETAARRSRDREGAV